MQNKNMKYRFRSFAIVCFILSAVSVTHGAKFNFDSKYCKNIAAVCESWGYHQGSHREGNGLYVDCLEPMVVRKKYIPILNAANGAKIVTLSDFNGCRSANDLDGIYFPDCPDVLNACYSAGISAIAPGNKSLVESCMQPLIYGKVVFDIKISTATIRACRAAQVSSTAASKRTAH